MKDVLLALGLGTPIYLALATYRFFRWLDRNASSQASSALSRWLIRQPFRIDLYTIILGAFDHLYTAPLFSITALRKSVFVSLVCYLIFQGLLIFTDRYTLFVTITKWSTNMFLPHGFEFLGIAISDYISLFLIRWSLRLAATRPFWSFAYTILAGVVIVVFSYIFTSLTFLLTEDFTKGGDLWAALADDLDIYFDMSISSWLEDIFWTTAPAFLVHLWLLLFLVGSGIARVLYTMLRAVQWGLIPLSQGDLNMVSCRR